MTQEEKDLLLKDLCARLPYNVKVHVSGLDFDFDGTLMQIYKSAIRCSLQVNFMRYGLEDVKPYLRPMSSMTEEEYVDFLYDTDFPCEYVSIKAGKFWTAGTCEFEFKNVQKVFDWLLEHHFDYRGLIDKGLAISTGEFNPYKV